MPRIIVVDRSGEEQIIEATIGNSVMQTIREAGQGELLALCGGCLSCATCHVRVADEWIEKLPPMSGDEDDLLSGSPHRTPLSRLSCQIRMSRDLDGLQVTIAPED